MYLPATTLTKFDSYFLVTSDGAWPAEDSIAAEKCREAEEVGQGEWSGSENDGSDQVDLQMRRLYVSGRLRRVQLLPLPGKAVPFL